MPEDSVMKNEKVSYWGHILGAHIKRIGYMRTGLGGGAMYLCIPPLIVGYVVLSAVFIQRLIVPLYGTKRLFWKDFVIIDRQRIEELTFFDKFNCMFCGFANGICVIVNKEIDGLANLPAEDMSTMKSVVLTFYCVMLFPVHFFIEFCFQIIFNSVVAVCMGMHKEGPSATVKVLQEANYAGAFHPIPRFFIRMHKNIVLRFAVSLEQIESAWCPLVHFEKRKGVVYPEHHKTFFGPDQLAEMHELLSEKGTVSARKPLY